MADEPRVITAIADDLFRLDVLEEAGRLAKQAPDRLTDLHLAHLAHYKSERELAGVLRRGEAARQQYADRMFAEANAHAAEQRRTAAATPSPIDAASLDGLTIEAICAKYPDVPVTMGLLGEVFRFANDMNERNKERNAKIAALEARVLELEASAAAVRP